MIIKVEGYELKLLLDEIGDHTTVRTLRVKVEDGQAIFKINEGAWTYPIGGPN